MLKIRLQRVARKHIPIFRVVLTDSRNSTKSGKAHEVLGTYNLITDEKRVDAERVKYWIGKGAQPSGTVHNFLVNERIIAGKKVNVLPKHRPIKKEAGEKEQETRDKKQETSDKQPTGEKKEEMEAGTNLVDKVPAEAAAEMPAAIPIVAKKE